MFNQSRQTVIQFIVLSAVIILLVRLFILQVLSPQYKIQAMDNAVARTTIYPDRGIIFDRNDKPVLENTVTHDLMIMPTQLKGVDTLGLCRILGIDTLAFRDRLVSSILKNGRYRPSVFEASLPVEKFVKLQESIYRFEPGFFLQDRPIRSYPYKVAAHLLGYIGEVDSSILKRTNFYYQMGDYAGLTGLERFYEPILMGQRGVKYQLKDNKNRLVGSYENGKFDTAATAGRSLRTYLDVGIQQLAEKFMANKLGAVVAIEPKTGGIIAMASGPTYDPNLLTGSERKRNFSWLLTDTARPLYNRAIKGQYPPGSTVKPSQALIGLDEGVITPASGIGCNGAYYGCNRAIKCTEHWSGHAASLRLAIAWSCNSFFSNTYRLAVDNPKYSNVREGYAAWRHYMNSFGLGVRLGVDLPSEDKGNVSDTSFYNKLYKGSWNSCTNVSLGIGQGEITATPLQMANLMCIIANKGYYYVPHFVKSIDGKSTIDTALNAYKLRHEVTHISDTMYQVVQMGMQDVVEKGTAKPAYVAGINIAGKTGTAENYGIINGKREKLQDHSWFVCFAPREDPKIAIAVVVENAGFGATWAGPIASLLVEKYLRDTLSAERLKEVDRIASKEIILPVVKQKRMRLDSLRRIRLALEMGDSSVLQNAPPPAPERPKLDINVQKDRYGNPVIVPMPEPEPDSQNRKVKDTTLKSAARLPNDERKKS